MHRFNSDFSYMRLTKELAYDNWSYQPYVKLLKDDVEFARFTIELLKDLTFILDKESPFYEIFKGPELSAKDAFEELFHMMKHELNEPSLDEELRELLHAKFKPTQTKTEIPGEDS